MARAFDKEKFLNKLPDEFQKLLRRDEDFSIVTGLWKLPAEVVNSLLPSVNEKLHPIFDWKFNKPASKRGKKSILPYPTDRIKLTGELMKSKVGAIITADGGLSGALQTVQVLAKIEVGGKIKTVSINNIVSIE
jgi:hypothetical protein